MNVVMRVIYTNGRGLLLEPEWVKAYDPDGMYGYGLVELTKQRDEARRFDDAAEALRCWKQTSTVRPTRDDGKPNRPLTAFTIELETVP